MSAFFLFSIMKLDNTQLEVLKANEIKIHLRNSTVEILTWLLKIIHRARCEQFHRGTIFFLRLLVDEMLAGHRSCLFSVCVQTICLYDT